MQRLLDHAPDLGRGEDGDGVEGACARAGRGAVGDVVDVVLRFLLDPALVAGLRPAALGVPAVDVVFDLADLDQAEVAAAEEAAVVAVDRGDAPGRAGQRLDQRLQGGPRRSEQATSKPGWRRSA